MWQALLQQLLSGDLKALARCISLIENEVEGYEDLLRSLPGNKKAKIIGITGPPGAGKSTLADALISELLNSDIKIGVLCVDPSSPFNFGALLGDRIRMSDWYNNDRVFIRSLATRGSLGGLNPKIIEITDLMKAAGYDFIIVETVGVGQSEVEIAGLADATVVVLVPEGGDVIQTMKAGLMEIADIFVVNKSDRPDADAFINNLKLMLAPAFHKSTHEIPVIKTIASQKQGIKELKEALLLSHEGDPEKRIFLLAEKAIHLIQNRKMKDISRDKILAQIKADPSINLYRFIQKFYSEPL